jgi:hypothetical protein
MLNLTTFHQDQMESHPDRVSASDQKFHHQPHDESRKARVFKPGGRVASQLGQHHYRLGLLIVRLEYV